MWNYKAADRHLQKNQTTWFSWDSQKTCCWGKNRKHSLRYQSACLVRKSTIHGSSELFWRMFWNEAVGICKDHGHVFILYRCVFYQPHSKQSLIELLQWFHRGTGHRWKKDSGSPSSLGSYHLPLLAWQGLDALHHCSCHFLTHDTALAKSTWWSCHNMTQTGSI